MRSTGLIWISLTYTRTSKYLLKTSWGHFREYLAHGAKNLITQLYCISIISLTLLLNKANKVKIWQIYRLVMITSKKIFAVINSPKCYLAFVFHRSSVDQTKLFNSVFYPFHFFAITEGYLFHVSWRCSRTARGAHNRLRTLFVTAVVTLQWGKSTMDTVINSSITD